MKKYLFVAPLLILGEEVISLAALSIVLVMVLCDFAKAAEKNGI